MRSTILNLCVALSASAAMSACGGSQSAGDTPGGESTNDTARDTKAAASQPSVPTASVPADPCGWIPVSEVEEVAGKLAEPPKREDGCRYTLVMPEPVSTTRRESIARQEQLNERFKAAFKDYQPLELGGPMANYERNPRTYAVTVSVDIEGSVAGELGMAAAGRVMESWLPPPGRSEGNQQPKAPQGPAGWDSATDVPYGFIGRIGHLRIAVQGQAPDVPDELMEGLAARVRDRIPDLPFPTDNPYQVIQLGAGDKNPCSLLTRPEAEAVLGPLKVEPYRSSSYYPPLALNGGHACAYFTAGHHVFVLSPTWSDGEEAFGLDKGVGGLVGLVAPQDTVVLKGPWDQGQVSNLTGALLFLKGDRMLEVHYLTSSTDRRGAVRLAAQAMSRLGTEAPSPAAVQSAATPHVTADPAWDRVVRLSDGRTLVTDGKLALDTAVAKPATIPSQVVGSAQAIEGRLNAKLPDEFTLGQLARQPQSGMYKSPSGVTLNAVYVDYLRRTPSSARLRLRMKGTYDPAIVLLNGTPVGLLMPMVAPR